MNRYLVVLIRRSDFDPAAVPLHQQFLQELRAEGRNEMSGPFGDNSGGAYLLRAVDLAGAGDCKTRPGAHERRLGD